MEDSKEKRNNREEEDFSELMEEYSLKSIKQSSHVEGTIIDIFDNNVSDIHIHNVCIIITITTHGYR